MTRNSSSVFFAILAAFCYGVSVPFSKLLLDVCRRCVVIIGFPEPACAFFLDCIYNNVDRRAYRGYGESRASPFAFCDGA